MDHEALLALHGPTFAIRPRRFAEILALGAERSGAKIVFGAKAIPNLQEGEISLAGRRLAADLFVLATGRSGSLGGRRRRVDRLIALCCPWQGGPDHLTLEAAPDGWWCATPVLGADPVLAFMTDWDLAPRGRSAVAAWLRVRWESSTVARDFGDMPDFELVRACPAETGQRTSLRGAGWVAVGDAAASLDPLCGFGIPAAMAKGAALARLLIGDGRDAALTLYEESERKTFAAFEGQRRKVYSRVAAWRTEPFWSRRLHHETSVD